MRRFDTRGAAGASQNHGEYNSNDTIHPLRKLFLEDHRSYSKQVRNIPIQAAAAGRPQGTDRAYCEEGGAALFREKRGGPYHRFRGGLQAAPERYAELRSVLKNHL